MPISNVITRLGKVKVVLGLLAILFGTVPFIIGAKCQHPAYWLMLLESAHYTDDTGLDGDSASILTDHDFQWNDIGIASDAGGGVIHLSIGGNFYGGQSIDIVMESQQ